MTTAGEEPKTEALPPAATETVDFVRDVAPIFVSRCVACHGDKKQESGFRLDRKKNALDGGDSGAAIVPGKSAESRLVLRIAGVNTDEVMPPEGEKLTAEQIGIIRAWIDQGADWPDSADHGSSSIKQTHWAYQPINRSDEPAVAERSWVRNPVDAFVLARLEEKQLAPSAEADRYTLCRRLYLDLLGLPPDPAEVDAFVNDPSPNAYEQLVDRLLKSPHFGERWGRHWLDAARYADSDGYEKDNPRPNAWRWRDWVIQAVNKDMPFDQFTIEQLAGDLLPNATPEQKLATAFHRQTLTNTEGGTDQEQWRVEAIFDRVETTGTVWLGLTLTCCRCHSHKYEPISQREYYQLFAFMNNGDETNLDVPTSEAEVARFAAQSAEHQKSIAAVNEKIATRRAQVGPEVGEWENRARAELAAAADKPVQFHLLEFNDVSGPKTVTIQRQGDGSYLVSGKAVDKADYTLTAKTDLSHVSGFRLDVLRDESLPGNGPGRASNGNFVLNEIVVQTSSTEDFKDRPNIALQTARADVAQDGFAALSAVDGDAKTGWAVANGVGQNHQLIALFPNDAAVDRPQWLKLTLAQQHGEKHTLGRFRIWAMTGVDVDSIAPPNVREILAVPATSRTPAQQRAVVDHHASVDPELRELSRQLAHLNQNPPKSPNMTVAVMTQRTENPRTTSVLRRGDFLSPLDEVKPGVPELLHAYVPRNSAAPDRLDFARWLMDPANTLTPRVAVNHVWLHLFGEGIVRTVNDFGVRGDPPTHPQLLDWLATEFSRLGWSRKALIKTIVMSATYRQSSALRPELAELDPQNSYLARQNRVRLEAEIIRDASLAAAGQLNPRIGGPSVFPPMPPDIAALSYSNNFKWNADTNENRYRRGMYTFFKRTAPHPNLTTFDCPDANTTCVLRRSSNTPLQALTTLNNEVFTEASQGMARRLVSEALADDDARVTRAFRLCLARRPEAKEKAALIDLLNSARAWYAGKADEAKQLAGDGLPTPMSPAEVAAWVATVRIIMNFDEFVTRE
jgi:mono/diheme cytochrome c family protein